MVGIMVNGPTKIINGQRESKWAEEAQGIKQQAHENCKRWKESKKWVEKAQRKELVNSWGWFKGQ